LEVDDDKFQEIESSEISWKSSDWGKIITVV
jgi:hypothetical protein